MRTGTQIRRLLRLDGTRVRSALVRPHAATWLGTGVPALLLIGGLTVLGRSVEPRVDTVQRAVLLGLVAAGTLASVAYPLLFRPADDAFLRRAGVAPAASAAHRSLRLAGSGIAIALLLATPYTASGGSGARALAVGGAAALAAAGLALPVFARAAARIASGRARGLGSRMIGWDPELARASPMVYAPVPSLLVGVLAAGWVGHGSTGAALRLGAVVALAAGAVAYGVPVMARALPRYAPRAGEMAYQPPAAERESGLVPRGGVYRLLGPVAAAVAARDGLLLERRHRWSRRLVWPVGVLGTLGMLRWGDHAGVRQTVALAGALVLLAQGATVLQLGREERANGRWLDRTAGVGTASRFLGRWSAGAGAGIWLALPLALAWGARGGEGVGWGWLLAVPLVAAVATAISLAAAGR